MPEYRTINECVDLIRTKDKDTSITAYFIRNLCKSGRVISFSSGSKLLVNYTDLENLLNKGE